MTNLSILHAVIMVLALLGTSPMTAKDSPTLTINGHSQSVSHDLVALPLADWMRQTLDQARGQRTVSVHPTPMGTLLLSARVKSLGCPQCPILGRDSWASIASDATITAAFAASPTHTFTLSVPATLLMVAATAAREQMSRLLPSHPSPLTLHLEWKDRSLAIEFIEVPSGPQDRILNDVVAALSRAHPSLRRHSEAEAGSKQTTEQLFSTTNSTVFLKSVINPFNPQQTWVGVYESTSR